MTLAAVALGGAMGACLRAMLERALSASFPHALYIANISGSFLLAFLHGSAPSETHPMLLSGICGALTTYSTFAVITANALREKQHATSFLHTALNFGGSVVAVLIGTAVTR